MLNAADKVFAAQRTGSIDSLQAVRTMAQAVDKRARRAQVSRINRPEVVTDDAYKALNVK